VKKISSARYISLHTLYLWSLHRRSTLTPFAAGETLEDSDSVEFPVNSWEIEQFMSLHDLAVTLATLVRDLTAYW